jgi:putative phosphoribosyl transferase
MDKYIDRRAAGRYLARQLQDYAHSPGLLVLALPRGGVPVAYEIAQALHVPLDVFIVRKLGLPQHPELAMGAIAAGGVQVFNSEVMRYHPISQQDLNAVIAKEEKELKRRLLAYRGDQHLPSIKGKTIILVDDGIATGASMRAAIKALRAAEVKRIIIAVPVAADDTCREIEMLADDFICPLQVKHFNAVGAWYEDFPQTEDEEVQLLLQDAKK